MKTLTASFTIIAFLLFAAPYSFAGDSAESAADNSARAAKVARAKAKSRAKAAKAGKQKSSYGNTATVTEGGCSNVDIGNVTNDAKVSGRVDNEVIITGDVIAISGPGCKK